MSAHYGDYGEILTSTQAAHLFGVSRETIYIWFRSGKTPFGPVILGKDYFLSGKELRIIKDRICTIAGILPKSKEAQ